METVDMEDKEKKSKLKEALKAAGVTGAGAAIGASVLDPEATVDAIIDYGWGNYPPLGRVADDIAFTNGGLWEKVRDNPNFGVGLNAAASGLGALAAYGVLKGVKKAIHNRDEKKLELARAIGEASKNGRA